MIILTCANKDTAKDDSGRLHKGFSFKGVIQETVKQAELNNYIPVVYDLGSLGIGEPFHINDKTFATKGYYERETQKGYKSKSLFKPKMVKLCMSNHDDLVAYLDGDAQLCNSIEEIVTDDYDIGVTLRDRFEIESEWHRDHFEIVKYLNAGVIFFNSTPAAREFVDTWERVTEEVGNDQKALNRLACPDDYPEPFSVLTINCVRIKYFPCKQYNYYYFEDGLPSNIKIMHFKGPVRRFYPFDWKKRLYCLTMIPALNTARSLTEKMLSFAGR